LGTNTKPVRKDPAYNCERDARNRGCGRLRVRESPRCRLRLVALIEQAAVIGRILQTAAAASLEARDASRP